MPPSRARTCARANRMCKACQLWGLPGRRECGLCRCGHESLLSARGLSFDTGPRQARSLLRMSGFDTGPRQARTLARTSGEGRRLSMSAEGGNEKAPESAGPRAQFESLISSTIGQAIEAVKNIPTLRRYFPERLRESHTRTPGAGRAGRAVTNSPARCHRRSASARLATREKLAIGAPRRKAAPR